MLLTFLLFDFAGQHRFAVTRRVVAAGFCTDFVAAGTILVVFSLFFRCLFAFDVLLTFLLFDFAVVVSSFFAVTADFTSRYRKIE